MPSCPSCGAGAPDGARFCENCGNELPSGCSNCGEPLAAGAVFCGNCGTRTGASAAATPAPPIAPPTPAPAASQPPVVPPQFEQPPAPPQAAPQPPQFQQPPAAQQFQQPVQPPMTPPATTPAAYPPQPVAAGMPPQQVNVHVGVPAAAPGIQQGQPGGWRVPVGYVFALLGGLIGIVLGGQLWRGKIAGPQGFKVPRFDESARFHGKIIFAIGCVMSVIWIMLNSAA